MMPNFRLNTKNIVNRFRLEGKTGKYEIVPDVPKKPLNLKVLSGILLLAVGIYFSLQYFDENTVNMIIYPISVILSFGVGVVALYVSKQYWGSLVFGRSYLALSIAYFSYCLGEIIFSFLNLFEYQSYPSIADIFFFLLYPFVIIHMVLNIGFFKSKITVSQKIWLPSIPLFFLMTYVIMSMSATDAELNFDFYYGLIFVSASSVTLSFSMLGAITFKKSLLGAVWLLLMAGILLNTVGDVWYYHLELFGLYTDQHIVNVIWHLSNMVLIYALFKHRL